jgi:serine/threonine protein kinase
VASGLAVIRETDIPANILLENGVQGVKFTDFGLTGAADDSSLSQSALIAGTPLQTPGPTSRQSNLIRDFGLDELRQKDE